VAAVEIIQPFISCKVTIRVKKIDGQLGKRSYETHFSSNRFSPVLGTVCKHWCVSLPRNIDELCLVRNSCPGHSYNLGNQAHQTLTVNKVIMKDFNKYKYMYELYKRKNERIQLFETKKDNNVFSTDIIFLDKNGKQIHLLHKSKKGENDNLIAIINFLICSGDFDTEIINSEIIKN